MNKERRHWRMAFLLVRLLWRFLSGQHLDGKERSNATFFSKGTWAKPHYWGRGKEPKWALMPGWQRAAIRWFCVGVPVGIVRDPMATVWAVALIAGPLAGLYAVVAIRVFYDFQHHREKIVPLHQALAPVLGVPLATRPRAWLTVPQDYGSNPAAVIEIQPPHDFTASDGDQAAILRTVQTKLGIEAPDAKWKLHGANPVILLSQSAPPPSYLEWRDVAEAVTCANADEVLFGLGKKRAPVAASLAEDSPHVGLNSGSGGGKTNTASLCALQFLHRGDVCAFIDYKLISYPWARALPNVAYAGRIEEIHDLLVWLGKELQRRNAVALAGLQPSGAIHANVGARLFLFAEELNYLVPELKAYWAGLRQYDKDLPKRSPALGAVAALAFAGRQARMHVFFIGQMLTVAATGSNDSSVRSNIGIACMARYTPQSWSKMSALTMPPVPVTPGRVQLATASLVRETQVPYLHLDEKDDRLYLAEAAAEWAREYAVNGTLTCCPADMPGAYVSPVPVGASVVHVPSDQRNGLGNVPALPPARPYGSVTLREAWQAGMFTSVEAARKAAQRYQPEVVGREGSSHLFLISDLAKCRNGRRP